MIVRVFFRNYPRSQITSALEPAEASISQVRLFLSVNFSHFYIFIFFSVQWFQQQKTIVTLLPNSRDNQGNYVKETSSDASPEKVRRGRKPGALLAKRHAMSSREKISKLKRAKKFKRDWSRGDSFTNNGCMLSSEIQEDNGLNAGKLGSRRTTERQSTFDIDNIYVDPKVAAVTRVEKIQYKEIQTPE